MLTVAKSPEMKKPIDRLVAVAKLLKVASGELYVCSLIKWWNWVLSTRCRMRPFDGLKKMNLNLWQKKEWCIPPEQDAAFVCHMEDILDIYKQPYDSQCPQVCIDEMSTQMDR